MRRAGAFRVPLRQARARAIGYRFLLPLAFDARFFRGAAFRLALGSVCGPSTMPTRLPCGSENRAYVTMFGITVTGRTTLAPIPTALSRHAWAFSTWA